MKYESLVWKQLWSSFLHAICQKLTCHVVKREKYSLAIYLLLYNKIHGTLMFAVIFDRVTQDDLLEPQFCFCSLSCVYF